MKLQLKGERLRALSMNLAVIHSEIQNRIVVYLWTGTMRIEPELVKNKFGQKIKFEDFISQRVHHTLNHSQILNEIRKRFTD